jgi:hypothetical protein
MKQNLTITAIALVLASSISLAANKTANMPSPTPEMRQKMAKQHEKMAACLRSDKPISECRQEMMRGCKDIMGPQGCPMMGGMGMGRHNGMRHHGMMQPTPEATATE